MERNISRREALKKMGIAVASASALACGAGPKREVLGKKEEQQQEVSVEQLREVFYALQSAFVEQNGFRDTSFEEFVDGEEIEDKLSKQEMEAIEGEFYKLKYALKTQVEVIGKSFGQERERHIVRLDLPEGVSEDIKALPDSKVKLMMLYMGMPEELKSILSDENFAYNYSDELGEQKWGEQYKRVTVKYIKKGSALSLVEIGRLVDYLYNSLR